MDTPNPELIAAMELKTKIIAHRGASGWYPEGTELALQKAVAPVEQTGDVIVGGADVLEIDLRVSKDGHLFLHHDETFKYTAGVDTRVADLDSAEIRSLNAGEVFRGGAFKERGLRFLEIEEALKMFPGQRFNIEMKGRWNTDSKVRLLDSIKKHSLRQNVVIASQKKANLRFFRKRAFSTSASWTEVGYALFTSVVGFGLFRPKYQIAQIWFPNVLSPGRIVSFLRKRNVETHFWTVNEWREIVESLEAAASGIITNFPGRVYEERETRKEMRTRNE